MHGTTNIKQWVVSSTVPPPSFYPSLQPARNIPAAGWSPGADQEGCEKSRYTPVFQTQTVQSETSSCRRNCGIMSLLDVVRGAVFIVSAFKVGYIFLWLRITQRSISLLFQYTSLYICTYHPALYFSPVSLHNIIYLHKSPSALFLFCFITLYYIFAHFTPALYFSPVSVHNITYLHISPSALLLSCFSTQHYISAHITQRSISLLFQ